MTKYKIKSVFGSDLVWSRPCKR